jgi:cell division protein FtsB
VADRPSRSAEEQRVEELLRVNAELAAEIRDLRLDRATRPRSAAVPSARRVARLIEGRDALEAQLQGALTEQERLEQRNRELERHNGELGGQIHELAEELARLRSGLPGLLGRARARLLRRRT